MTLPNIALTGKLRSGKSAAADYLRDKYGYTQFAFGDELKRYYHELFDVPRDPKPREGYQWFGQTMRARDPDIWVRKCLRSIEIERETAEPVKPFRAVITDLRQPNEFRRCRAEGFVIILVHAPDHIRLERARQAGDAFTAADLTHETEMYVDTFPVDYVIYNKYTLDELYTQIDVIMSRYRPQ